MLDAQFTRRAAFRRWSAVLDEVGITLDPNAAVPETLHHI
jgi:hypothetical protein